MFGGQRYANISS